MPSQTPEQLDLLSFSPAARPEPKQEQAVGRNDLAALRQKIPRTVQFGTVGWEYPGWTSMVWKQPRSEQDLARDGLVEYAAHPLLSTIYIQASGDSHASQRDLRRYAGQLPDNLHCILQVHPEVTIPRFTRQQARQFSSGRAGQANPHFLSSSFFAEEILHTYMDVFGDRLGPFLFTFPPGMARAGLSPEAFAERLDKFLAAVAPHTACAIELHEPEFLSLDYARTLATHAASHVFTTTANMPSLLQQARSVPTSPEVLIHIDESETTPGEHHRSFSPFDRVQRVDTAMRQSVVDLLMAVRGLPTYVLVDNQAEGCAPLTVVALARLLAARLGSNVSKSGGKRQE